MKKLFALILALAYLSTSSGMVVNVQYCFDTISSVDVNGFGDKDNCCCTGAEKTAGCCSDEIKVVKLQDSHKVSVADYSLSNSFQLFSTPLSLIDFSANASIDTELLRISDSSPPLTSAPSLCIMNCEFRI